MSSVKASFETSRQQLHESLAPVIVRYQALSAVEHLLVMSLVWLLVLTMLVVLLVMPLYRWQQAQEMRFTGQRDLVQWIQSHQHQFSSGSGGGALPAGQSLQSVITRDANRAKITLQRYEPKGDTALRVWINQVPFDDLLSWLVSLDKKFGIQIGEISIEYKPTVPGEVKATIVFNG